jgi:hypothetical protein
MTMHGMCPIVYMLYLLKVKCLFRTLSGAGPLQNPMPTVHKLAHDDFDAAVREVGMGESNERI